MTKKHLILLSVIFGMLAAAALLRSLQTPRGVVSNDLRPLDFSVDVSKVDLVRLSRDGSEELAARRENGAWVLPHLWNAPADEEKIRAFLEGLSGASGELRAEDETLLEDFGITDKAGLRIELADASGRTLLDVFAGTKRGGPGSTFLRRAGSSAVYASGLDLFGRLGLYGNPAKDRLQARVWADLEPLKLDVQTLRGIEVIRADSAGPVTAASLQRAGEDSDWTLTRTYENFRLDAAKVETFVQALQRLRASGIADPSDSYGLETPSYEIRLKTTEGEKTLFLSAQGEDEQIQYLKLDGSPVIYEITRFTLNELAADDSRFFAGGLLPEEAVVESILLKKQGRETRLEDSSAEAFQEISKLLKQIEPAGLLLTSKEKDKIRSPGIDSIEVTLKEGKTAVFDFGEPAAGGISVVLRGSVQAFAVSEADYEALFSSFTVPETNASQAAPDKAK